MKDVGNGDIPPQKAWGLVLFGLICLAGMVTASAQPTNDNFANRALFTGTNIAIYGSLSNATSEVGEPLLPDISSGQTAWWTWIAPTNGIVDLAIYGTGFNPLLTVFTGDNFASASLVASNTFLACYEHAECGCHWRFRNYATFHVAAGRAYQIAVDSGIITDAGSGWVAAVQSSNLFTYAVIQTTNVIPGGSFRMEFYFTAAPANDDFENRIPLSGTRVRLTTSNRGATKQANEPAHLGNNGGSSVWYSWVAPATGRVTLSTNSFPPYLPPSWSFTVYSLSDLNQMFHSGLTCGNEIDQNTPPKFFPVFGAYTGSSIDSLVSANAFSLALADYPYAVAFDVIKGNTYQIAFDGNEGTTGDIDFSLALTKPASNDNFNKRIAMHGIYVVATGFNAGATSEPGEPAPPANSAGKSVWWSWTAPVSGTVSIDLTESDRSFPAAVYIGSSLSNLTCVASGVSNFVFEAVQGETYQIAIDDAAGATGATTLTLQAPVVAAALKDIISRSSAKALLVYNAVNGQKLLLQTSTDGFNWQNLKTANARKGQVSFLAKPAPQAGGPYYRALVVDYRP